MKNVQTYRAMGSICRQRAVFDPERRWKHLGDAERWDHLAHVEIASHFRECNTASPSDLSSNLSTARQGELPSVSSSDISSDISSDLAAVDASPVSNDKRWETIVAA